MRVSLGIALRGLNDAGGAGLSTSLRLAKYFGTSPEFWMNLQSHYDLRVERRNLAAVDAIQPLQPA